MDDYKFASWIDWLLIFQHLPHHLHRVEVRSHIFSASG